LQFILELLQLCLEKLEQRFNSIKVVEDFGAVDVMFGPLKAHRSVPGRFKDARRRNRIE
jgi:hypothetical protein